MANIYEVIVLLGVTHTTKKSKRNAELDPLRRSSVKIGMIQTRLAWPLRKDDTHTSTRRQFRVQRNEQKRIATRKKEAGEGERVTSPPTPTVFRPIGHTRNTPQYITNWLYNDIDDDTRQK